MWAVACYIVWNGRTSFCTWRQNKWFFSRVRAEHTSMCVARQLILTFSISIIWDEWEQSELCVKLVTTLTHSDLGVWGYYKAWTPLKSREDRWRHWWMCFDGAPTSPPGAADDQSCCDRWREREKEEGWLRKVGRIDALLTDLQRKILPKWKSKKGQKRKSICDSRCWCCDEKPRVHQRVGNRTGTSAQTLVPHPQYHTLWIQFYLMCPVSLSSVCHLTVVCLLSALHPVMFTLGRLFVLSRPARSLSLSCYASGLKTDVTRGLNMFF